MDIVSDELNGYPVLGTFNFRGESIQQILWISPSFSSKGPRYLSAVIREHG